MKTSTKPILSLLLAPAFAFAQAATDDYRGLWVGQATLTHVNQVTVPLNENNDPEPKDPAVPQRTADAAHLRLIVHVDGEGNATLLKDVAILQRSTGTETTGNALALVSDERLYPDFPQQEAVRIASAVFDFGDHKATEALDALVDEISGQVAASVDGSRVSSTSTDAETATAETDAQTAAEDGVANQDLLSMADIETRFDAFMADVFDNLDAIINGDTSMVDPAATALADSVYGDPRGTDLLAAMAANTNEAEAIAWRYADTGNEYLRTITGNTFAQMIAEAAEAAGIAATNDSASVTSVSNAIHELQTVINVKTDALAWKAVNRDDTAIVFAVDEVLDATLSAALTFTNSSVSASYITAEVEHAAWDRQAELPRFTPPASIPSTDYTDFVESAAFLNSVPGAAEAAAKAAVSARKSDPFIDQAALFNVAKLAARDALLSVYIEAANARRTELPMVGDFGPGNGSTNLAIAATAPGGLRCTIDLPAAHPTNPFRHAKHPDHIRGIDIVRYIRLDFHGSPGDPAAHTASGSVELTGIYREELFGLHKKLGANSDIGLRVEGSFELNRISRIDTLNAK